MCGVVARGGPGARCTGDAAALAQTRAGAARARTRPARLPTRTDAQAGAPRRVRCSPNPIRCWWKTDRTAVRVGERFGLVLTCGVIETGPITVVPALNQLEPGAHLADAVRGRQRDAPRRTSWRRPGATSSSSTAVRLLSDGFFGQDVNIPALTVTYNLQDRRRRQHGRDQSYMLPALPMRMLSLVPRSATDIRDASGETFGDIESRRFRATVARVVSWVAIGVRRGAGRPGASARDAAASAKRAPGSVRPCASWRALGACVAGCETFARRRARPAGRRSWRAARCRRCALPARRRSAGRSPSSGVERDAEPATDRSSCAPAGSVAAARCCRRPPRVPAWTRPRRERASAAGPEPRWPRSARRSSRSARPPTAVTPRRPTATELTSALDQRLDAVQRLRIRRAAGRCARLTRRRAVVLEVTSPCPIRACSPSRCAPPSDEWWRTRWEDLQFSDAARRRCWCSRCCWRSSLLVLLVRVTLGQRAGPHARGPARRCCR